MTISFISSATGTNTATLGTHQAGDLILVFAFRDGNNTAPSLPSSPTFNNIQASGANTCSARMGWRIATSASESVGTWTNATSVIAAVYRGINSTTPIGGSAITGGSSTVISYPAVTMQVTDNTSWIVGAAGHRSTNVAIETAPTGLPNRTSVSDATDEAALFDSNGTRTSWSAQTASVGGTASGWRSITTELRAETVPTLTSATVSSVSSTSGTPSVSTNKNSGTAYMVCVPDGDSPSVAQIKAGQRSNGTSAINAQNQTVTATGVQTFSTVTGLTTGTPYDFWFVHTNSEGDSSAVKADFTPNNSVSLNYTSVATVNISSGSSGSYTENLFNSVTTVTGRYYIVHLSAGLINGAPSTLTLNNGLGIAWTEIATSGDTAFRTYFGQCSSGATGNVTVSVTGAPSSVDFSGGLVEVWDTNGLTLGIIQASSVVLDATSPLNLITLSAFESSTNNTLLHFLSGDSGISMTITGWTQRSNTFLFNGSPHGLLSKSTADTSPSISWSGGSIGIVAAAFELGYVPPPADLHQYGSTLFWGFP